LYLGRELHEEKGSLLVEVLKQKVEHLLQCNTGILAALCGTANTIAI